MCGRFTITVTMDELFAYFAANTSDLPFATRYNAAPGQMIPAVIAHEGKNRIGELRWGLVPAWARDEKIGYKLINAKAETLRTKPSFRESFLRRRCIIPADSFYEWKQLPSGGKQPYRIFMKERKLFGFAGLYDKWTNAEGRTIHTCTIITTTPNRLMEPIHNRMPVILQKEDEALWLNRSFRVQERLQDLLQPYPADAMDACPVHPKVGNVKNDDASCIEPFEIQQLF